MHYIVIKASFTHASCRLTSVLHDGLGKARWTVIQGCMFFTQLYILSLPALPRTSILGGLIIILGGVSSRRSLLLVSRDRVDSQAGKVVVYKESCDFASNISDFPGFPPPFFRNKACMLGDKLRCH